MGQPRQLNIFAAEGGSRPPMRIGLAFGLTGGLMRLLAGTEN